MAVKDKKINLFTPKIKLTDKITFLQNMSIMIKSGIPIIEALDVVKEDIDSPALASATISLAANLEKGESVYQALKKEKDFLNDAHMGILQAGELTGQLFESLTSIKEDLQKEYNLFQKVKGALTYPAVIMLALFGIGGGIIIFILPKLAAVFSRMGIALPLPTRIMVGMGGFISENMILVIVAIVVLIVGEIIFIGSQAGKRFLSFLALKTPIVKSLISDINFTRFTRTLAVMNHAGVNIDEALLIGSQAFPVKIREIIKNEVAENVRTGKSLAESFKSTKSIFPGIVIRMVAVGESSGNLNEVLTELSEYFDRRVDAKLVVLTNMLEPIIMLLVGLAIGGVVLSIIGPIYSMMGELQQSF